jgi:hypothetical protein
MCGFLDRCSDCGLSLLLCLYLFGRNSVSASADDKPLLFHFPDGPFLPLLFYAALLGVVHVCNAM